MSILIPGTEKLAETVDIAVKWGSANLTGKIVPAGTPLTAAGEVATGDKAVAVRGITAIDYGYSPYSNSCPCIVAGVVDMTKVLFKVTGTDKGPICVALDQISFIDANKKVYHPSVVSQIPDNSLDGSKLGNATVSADKLSNIRAVAVCSGTIDTGGVVTPTETVLYSFAFFQPDLGGEEVELWTWGQMIASPNNPLVSDGDGGVTSLFRDSSGEVWYEGGGDSMPLYYYSAEDEAYYPVATASAFDELGSVYYACVETEAATSEG